MSDLCLICLKPVLDYEPEYCCNGHDCGCMAMPIEPCICSDACWKACMDGIGETMDQRRIDAGIDVWTESQP